MTNRERAEACDLDTDDAVGVVQLAAILDEAEARGRAAAVTEDTSDGYHTFKELYDHRITLFIAVARMVDRNDTVGADTEDGKDVWRSKVHSDGSVMDGWFVLGIFRSPGEQITYHLPLSRWDETDFAATLDEAPGFDGHTSTDVLERLKKL